MKYENPRVTADVIALRDIDELVGDEALFIRRGNEPFKGMYAIPGGHINYGEETVKQAAQREFKEETSLDVELEDLVYLGYYSDPDRDPRGHYISHVYFARQWQGEPRAGDDADEVKWFSLDALPELAFDHNKMMHDFKRKNRGIGNGR